MSTVNCVSFRGHGSESTGSIAHKEKPTTCPTCGREIGFKGRYDSFEKQNEGSSMAGTVLTLAGLTAAGIVGLAYAHKTSLFSKMKEGKIRDLMMKLDPASKKCHEWCSTAKTKSTELWTKVKDKFSSKKD